jgi:hypothetical protein
MSGSLVGLTGAQEIIAQEVREWNQSCAKS